MCLSFYTMCNVFLLGKNLLDTLKGYCSAVITIPLLNCRVILDEVK